MAQYAFSDLLSDSPVRVTATCVIDDGQLSLTGPELLGRITDLRREFSALVGPGEVVCVVMPSSAAYMLVQAALLDLGAIFVAVPSDATHLTAVVSELGSPKWFVYPRHAPSPQHRHADNSGVLSVDMSKLSVRIEQNPTCWTPVSAATESGRVVVATSGSTGRSKLVNLSPLAYWYAGNAIAQVTSIEASDTVLHHLPLQRGAGWLAWGALAAGARNIIEPVRSADFPEALKATGATATFSVSVGLHELVRRDWAASSLPRLRTLYYSSGTVSVDMKHALAERFGGRLIQDYGMTEVPEPLTVLSRGDHLRGLQDRAVLASVGRTLHTDRVRTDRPATANQPAPIWVRSPYMFDGYWGGPRRASQSWYRTDDLGYIDPDGYLFLTGRQSRTVRSGGVSFALSDIQAALESIPAILKAELSVVPDQRFGERVQATVMATDPRLGAAQIKVALAQHVVDARMAAIDITVNSLPTLYDDTKEEP
ncbi:long-chain fatty acid--CoA ligase [Mycolicibacterium murale]|nr:fatty acid--CoA ligase family protein [Mycolicibacterium murale]MCV7180417.1 long-chain fatty acid--CoA ligase [Mycolicibacterium murale]